MVLDKESGVTILNGYATFNVRFKRPLQTRERVEDANLVIGENLLLQWSYKIKKYDEGGQRYNDHSSDRMVNEPQTYIEILNQSYMLAVTAVSGLVVLII